MRKRFSVNEFGYPDVWKNTRLIINRLGRTIIHNNNKASNEKTTLRKRKTDSSASVCQGVYTQKQCDCKCICNWQTENGSLTDKDLVDQQREKDQNLQKAKSF